MLPKAVLLNHISLDGFMEYFSNIGINQFKVPQNIINELYSISKATDVNFEIAVNLIDDNCNYAIKQEYYLQGAYYSEESSYLYNVLTEETCTLAVEKCKSLIKGIKENINR